MRNKLVKNREVLRNWQMAELDSVHRYAAGGLFALALSQAQIQQHSLPGFGFPPVLDPTDGHSSLLSLAGDGILPWSCEQSGLLRHIFRSEICYPVVCPSKRCLVHAVFPHLI